MGSIIATETPHANHVPLALYFFVDQNGTSKFAKFILNAKEIVFDGVFFAQDGSILCNTRRKRFVLSRNATLVLPAQNPMWALSSK
ncbi:hypothetical protein PsorP6_009875 [Peronosclerospora sorghi]|uniref:Uncharacterized protein n=1 Tax=Peronosclerospora sorghi TaxID=230839 RepID=A0ACC0W0F5_9STRA|nr:hypothetical protein PsorP6_009875 [Peronosclerospora sorghi]